MLQRYADLQRRKSLNKDEGGFTLIELLIVIVVLGILAAVVVFALGGVTGQSAVAACNTDAKTVETGIAAYTAQNGNIATTATFSTAAAATTAGQALVQSDLVPTSGTKYLHTWPSNPSHYTILANGSTTGTTPNIVWTANGDVLITPQVNGAAGTQASFDTQTSSTGCNAVT